MPFGLQPLDLIVIVVVALVIFGPKRLPQIGRWLGKTFSSFRKGARDLADGFSEETRVQDATGTGGTAADAGPAPRPTAIFCTACGASNPADSRFCNKCGTRLPA
jgi:sec-independent protein translocase protein TatA